MLPETMINCRVWIRKLQEQSQTARFVATVAGTTEYSATRGGLSTYSVIPRTGLRVSKLVYGGDAVGATVASRAQGMHAALQSGLCNAVNINISELSARQASSSPLYTKDSVSRFWEAHVVQDCISRSNPARDAVVVMGTVAVAADGEVASPGPIKPTAVGGVPILVKDALDWLGHEDGVDILMAHVPPTLAVETFPSLLKTLESIVELGYAKSYGISTTAFTALDAPGSEIPALPIRKLFAAAERCSPKHNLSCVAYEATVGKADALLKEYVDSKGQEASLAYLIRGYGIAQFVRKPFDVYQHGKLLRLASEKLPNGVTGETVGKTVSDAINLAFAVEKQMNFSVLTKEGAGDAPSEQDCMWARIVASSANFMDSLPEWQAMSHYGIGRSVERVTKYAHASANEEVKQWAGEYRAAMIELVHAVTQLHVFHHMQQMEKVEASLAKALRVSSLPASVETTIAKLLLDAGFDGLLTEVPTVFDKPSFADVSRFDAVPADVLASTVLPTILRPRPSMK